MFDNISKVLVISDMDGTFLPTNKIPSQKNLNSIKQFQKDGGKFSIGTGRSVQATTQYFDSFQVNFPFILCNGGMIYDNANKKSLFDVYLPDISLDYTKKIFDRFETVGGEILTIDTVYVPRLTECEKEHLEICQVEPVICSLEEIPKQWYKVLFCDKPENIDIIQNYVESNSFPNVDFVRSSDKYYEMLPQNVTKGYALEKMRDICKLKDYTIVAVGDYDNDIEMLKAADIAFCPSNAIKEVKDVSDVILENSCDQDAIAAVIDYIYEKTNK